MSDRGRLPSLGHLVAWSLLLAITGLLWTAAASAVFLSGTGLVRYFPFQGIAWVGQWWSYALYAPANSIVGRWLMFGAGAPTVF
ncbi:MAG: hypothetical protein EON48_16855, partial [Acetobacteraceae bacterium]